MNVHQTHIHEPSIVIRRKNVTNETVHIKLDSLPISVAHLEGGIDIRADWKKIKWDKYDTLAQSVREIVSLHVDLPLGEVSVVCSLFIVGQTAAARMSIDLPKTHRARLANPPVQTSIGEFLDVLKNGRRAKPSDIAEKAPALIDEELISSSEVSEEVERLAEKVQEIGQRARAVLGGCTLRVPCSVESPAWNATFEVSGKLAPKPRVEAAEPELKKIDVSVEGFRRDRRLVYLAPVLSPSDVQEVAFDQEKLLACVVGCVSIDALTCRAVVEEVAVGPKVKRTLLSLVPLKPAD